MKTLRAFHKYIKVKKCGDSKEYSVWLVIDQQSFCMGLPDTKKVTQWRKRQLAIALQRMFEHESQP